jgi:CubicO group peptidase (beta-lactamase class C family)
MLAKMLTIAGVLALPPAALAADVQSNHIARIEADLEPWLQVHGHPVTAHTLSQEMATHNTPAISIAVVDHGKIIWAKAYGMADVASERAATTRTLFQAGSISKPVAASAAMQLVQEGLLSLDKPANSQLVSWQIPDSPLTKDHPVTLRHLLSHTGGLTVHGFRGYAVGTPVPSVIEVLDGKSPANSKPVVVEVQPGAQFNYSGGGITIVQLMMTEATRKTFPDLMWDRVLRPLDMDDSTYDQPLTPKRAAFAATGYLRDGKPVDGRFHIYPEMAAAGLWTTPSDLAKWAIGLESAYDGDSSVLMSPASAKQMLTPGLGHWGLGVGVGGTGDDVYFNHNGDDWGFKANLIAWPKGKRAVVAMANGDDGMDVVLELMQAVIREYGWKGLEPKVVYPVTLTKAQSEAVEGNYGQGAAVISADGSGLVLTFRGSRVGLVPIGDDAFIAGPGDLNMSIKLSRRADGTVDVLAMRGAAFPRDR